MNSIDLIRVNLQRSQEIVLSRVEDMREHCFVFPTPKGGCHTVWILGHLAFIEALVIEKFMLGKPNSMDGWAAVFDSSEVIDEPSIYPTFDETLGMCRQQRRNTISLIGGLDESDLDVASKNCPNNAKELFGDFRSCLQYVSDHWFMHRGQLADARRAAGIEKMWY